MTTRENQSKENQTRGIVLDVDDVILNSSETVIAILNKRYNITPPKERQKHLKDWGFRSIVKDITTKEIMEIFESEEFWELVTIRDEFKRVWENKKIKQGYDWSMCSKCTRRNAELKKDFLSKYLNLEEIESYFMILDDKMSNYSKKEIDMTNCIQIDDRYDSLDTNAKLKILLKNGIETSYNQIKDTREDLYVINDLTEFEQILLFNLENEGIL